MLFTIGFATQSWCADSLPRLLLTSNEPRPPKWEDMWGAAPSEVPKLQVKVKLKKRVFAEIQRLNDAEWGLRLGAVAKALAAIDAGLAMGILRGMVSTAAEDPTAWVCEAAREAAVAARSVRSEDMQVPMEPPCKKVKVTVKKPRVGNKVP